MKIENSHDAKVRFATDTDLPFLIRGLEENRRIEKRNSTEISATEKDIEAFQKGIVNQTIFIADHEGKQIGFLHYVKDFPLMYISHPFYWVDLVFVDESFRSKGVGKKLYERVIKNAAEKNIRRIMIDVFDENESSIKFHETLGFKRIYGIFELEIQPD